MLLRYSTLFILFGLIACETSVQDAGVFEKGKVLGVNKNDKLEEASGLVASVRNPGYLWTHNDSGNPAKIFLLDSTAVTAKAFKLDKIKNRDWEDITLGPGPEEGISYLYVGDIGDNLSRYDFKYIYRFKEPSINDPELITQFDTITVKLSDQERDTEALMIDPITKNIYLISKREESVNLYEIKYPFTTDTLVAQNIGTLPIEIVVAANISQDGKEVLIKTYQHVYYFRKKGEETIPELLKTVPMDIPYRLEPQGESIAWAGDGSGFYTLGENGKGERSKLYFYKRK